LKQPNHKLVTSTSKVKQTANRLPLGIVPPAAEFNARKKEVFYGHHDRGDSLAHQLSNQAPVVRKGQTAKRSPDPQLGGDKLPLAQPDSICKVQEKNFLSCKTSSGLVDERLISIMQRKAEWI